MRIAVDLRQCENHGQCTFLAPDVFSLDEDGRLSFRAEADEEYVSGDLDQGLAEDIEEAIDMCPVQAIRRADA